jgi:CBS domain-containing protein
MKVQEIMTRGAETCALETGLAEAAHLMWDGDCGILPVVQDGGLVVGVITDRDICMAAALNGELLTELPVSRVITSEVYACQPETDVRDALKTMQQHRVRRLPIVNDEGRLQGILSMNDLALEAKDGTNGQAELSYADVVMTMKAICAHRDLPQVETQPPQQAMATATA